MPRNGLGGTTMPPVDGYTPSYENGWSVPFAPPPQPMNPGTRTSLGRTFGAQHSGSDNRNPYVPTESGIKPRYNVQMGPGNVLQNVDLGPNAKLGGAQMQAQNPSSQAIQDEILRRNSAAAIAAGAGVHPGAVPQMNAVQEARGIGGSVVPSNGRDPRQAALNAYPGR